MNEESVKMSSKLLIESEDFVNSLLSLANQFHSFRPSQFKYQNEFNDFSEHLLKLVRLDGE